MENSKSLCDHLVALLQGGQAYDTFEAVVGEVPADARGRVPANAERSPWQILEHIRIAQRDILDFSRNQNGDYVEKAWPDDYWPKRPEPPTAASWNDSVREFLKDRAEFEALVAGPASDLYTPFPWGSGQTLLREVLLAADHTSHHLGQMMIVTRLLTD